MKVKTKEYKQLDGSVKTQVSEVGEGVLRRFDKTPFPMENSMVVCPHFMLLAWANGCPYDCSWCFLKGTFRFQGQDDLGRVPMTFKDRERVAKHLEAFLQKATVPEIINCGELCDGLMDEGRRLPSTFSEFIMGYFAGSKHKVLFLTKSTNVQKFLDHARGFELVTSPSIDERSRQVLLARADWRKNAILAWSVNASAVSEKWEKLSPSPLERLDSAKKVYDAGFEVRLRIDPMVALGDWKSNYSGLVDEIYKRLKPSVITLGCLRGLATTVLYAKDKSWTEYLTEKSNWGKKPPFTERLAMYKFMFDCIRKHDSSVRVGVCKETLEMHKALKINPAKMRCNCVELK